MDLAPRLALCACLIAPLSLAAAEGDDDVVESVLVEGASRTHPARVLGELRTRAGMTRAEALRVGREDVSHIEGMGPFTGVSKRVEEIAPGRCRIVFSVRELSYVGEIRFTGVTHFTRRTIEKKIALRRGGFLNPLLLEADRRTLLDHFRDATYLNAAVEAQVATDPATGISTVTFAITPGLPVKVGTLVFRGLPPEISRRKMTNELIEGANPSRMLLNRPGQPYEAGEVAADAHMVAGGLADLGFLDARVVRTSVHHLDLVPAWDDRAGNGPLLAPDGRTRDRIAVTYDIEPGGRWSLGSVDFVLDDLKGATSVTATELREAFALEAGHLYLARDIERAKSAALALLRNRGHARAGLREDRRLDVERRRVDLVLHLVEGDRYRVRRLDIDGNTVTKDQVVRRGLALKPGQLWSDRDRDRSVREIRRTGVFDDGPGLRPTALPQWDSAGPAGDGSALREVDVGVRVNETGTGQFRFELGYSTSTAFNIGAEFTERNFDALGTAGMLTGQGSAWRGAGQVLKASVKYNSERTSLGTSWSNPHLWDGPYSLSLAFNRTDGEYTFWDSVRHVSTLTVGRSFLDNDLRLAAFYSYTDLEVSDLETDAPDDALDHGGDHFLNTFGLRQTLDLLDNPRMPTSGLRLQFEETMNGDWMPASEDYRELRFDADAFLPLHTGDIGGVTFLRLSQLNRWLDPLGDTDVVPYYDRLRGGGPAPAHRGFDRWDLGPREVNRNGYETEPGGTREWLTTLELSLPLQGTNDGFRGVVFIDHGLVWQEGADLAWGDLRTAAGLGVRFPAMILPVSLDFSWLLDAEGGEDSFLVHFAITGFSF